MKILADIIICACSRFNIDPKDLFDDPVSSAQSKSSSYARTEGDRNVDWLALDSIEGCGGQDYLVKAYKG